MLSIIFSKTSVSFNAYPKIHLGNETKQNYLLYILDRYIFSTRLIGQPFIYSHEIIYIENYFLNKGFSSLPLL